MTVELTKLFRQIAALQENDCLGCKKNHGCDASCCSISTMGGEPSVTDHEVKLINAHLQTLEGFTFYEAGPAACKFLDTDGRCKIYPVRPIDCRMHFCASETMESQAHSAGEDLVDAYHRRQPVSFYNAQLIDSCKFVGE